MNDPSYWNVQDMIMTCDCQPGEHTIRRLLDICEAMNKRINILECQMEQTANIASCLANGIKPD